VKSYGQGLDIYGFSDELGAPQKALECLVSVNLGSERALLARKDRFEPTVS
jgi:hypothetical protein